MIGFVYSDQQARCRRSSAVRQQSCCCRSFITIEVGKYLLNNRWVFDAGDDLDETGTFVTNIRLLEGLLLADTGNSHHCK